MRPAAAGISLAAMNGSAAGDLTPGLGPESYVEWRGSSVGAIAERIIRKGEKYEVIMKEKVKEQKGEEKEKAEKEKIAEREEKVKEEETK